MQNAAANMNKLYWRSRGYELLTLVFDRTVEHSQFSTHQMKHLRKTFTAKASLDYNEIVGAYAKRGTKIANDLKDSSYPTLNCGVNPHFSASTWMSTGKSRDIQNYNDQM
jgi:hypothetical protein